MPSGRLVVISMLGEPRGKQRVKFSRKSGRAYNQIETINTESALRVLAQEAMAGLPLIEGPVRLEITAYFAIPTSWSAKKKLLAQKGGIYPTKKPDASNILKFEDALNGIVWRDDAQVVHANITKSYSDIPSLYIRVSPI